MKNTIEFLKYVAWFVYLITPSFFLCMWLAEKWPEVFSSGPLMALITATFACFLAAVAIDILNWLRERNA